MSKSLGNLYRLDDLQDRGYTPSAFRYLCLTTHYRKPLNFTWEGLEAAQNALKRLRREIGNWKLEIGNSKLENEDVVAQFTAPAVETHCNASLQNYRDRFLAAINDDLNLPQTLAVVWDLVKSVRGDVVAQFTARQLLQEFDKVLGLDLFYAPTQTIPQVVKQLVEEREQHRQQGHFDKSDQIRQKILELGYTVEDTPKGPQVRLRA